MGRDPKVFLRPEQYQPSRWLRTETQYFKSLGFGFGPRQCLGRRIAEAEMQIFLIHVRRDRDNKTLLSYLLFSCTREKKTLSYLLSLQMLENFKVEKMRHVEVQSTFELILLPEKPITLTLKPLSGGR